jgi:hypothetical protein
MKHGVGNVVPLVRDEKERQPSTAAWIVAHDALAVDFGVLFIGAPKSGFLGTLALGGCRRLGCRTGICAVSASALRFCVGLRGSLPEERGSCFPTKAVGGRCTLSRRPAGDGL